MRTIRHLIGTHLIASATLIGVLRIAADLQAIEAKTHIVRN